MGADNRQVLDLADDLRELAQHDPERAVAIVQDGAKEHEEMSVRICPVDTGNLRHSIKKNDTAQGAEIIANANGLAPYAPKVEFGTHRQRAQPYMRPPTNRVLNQIAEDSRDALGNIGGGA